MTVEGGTTVEEEVAEEAEGATTRPYRRRPL